MLGTNFFHYLIQKYYRKKRTYLAFRMNMFIPLIQIQSNELFAGNTTTYQSLEKTGQNNKLQFYCDN